MGMFDFLTGKKAKVNLTPDMPYQSQESLYYTSPMAAKEGFSLKELAKRRLQGQDLGFGDDFVSKNTNPIANQAEADFTNKTMPRISSEASKRGLGRSSLVTDQIGQAEAQKNRDVEQMMATFMRLNEAQKKTDMTEGINLASNLQNQQRSMLDNMSAASERQVGRNVAERDSRAESEAQAGGRLFQAGGTLLGGPLGGTITSALGMGNQNIFSGFDQNTSTDDLIKLLYGGQSGVQTPILGGQGHSLGGRLY